MLILSQRNALVKLRICPAGVSPRISSTGFSCIDASPDGRSLLAISYVTQPRFLNTIVLNTTVSKADLEVYVIPDRCSGSDPP